MRIRPLSSQAAATAAVQLRGSIRARRWQRRSAQRAHLRRPVAFGRRPAGHARGGGISVQCAAPGHEITTMAVTNRARRWHLQPSRAPSPFVCQVSLRGRRAGRPGRRRPRMAMPDADLVRVFRAAVGDQRQASNFQADSPLPRRRDFGGAMTLVSPGAAPRPSLVGPDPRVAESRLTPTQALTPTSSSSGPTWQSSSPSGRKTCHLGSPRNSVLLVISTDRQPRHGAAQAQH